MIHYSSDISAQTSSQPHHIKRLFKIAQYLFAIYAFYFILMVSFSLGAKLALGILMAAPLLLGALQGSRNGYLRILYFICIAFVIGQRTIHLGDYVRIVPSEALLWGLAILCMRLPSPPRPADKAIPVSAAALCLASSWGILLNQFSDLPYLGDINLALAYAKQLWMAIPAFFVCHRVLRRFEEMQNIITILALGSLCLSTFGIAEYYHLGFINYFQGFVDTEASDVVTPEGFYRARASFWGGPAISYMLSLFLPLVLAHWHSSRTLVRRILMVASLVSSVLMIYYAGHRGIWISTLFAIAIYYYLKGFKKAASLVLLFWLILPKLPSVAVSRIHTISGAYEDSSAHKRKQRAHDTWLLVKKNPILGNGWGAAGLAHTDLLQYWADAGLPCILAFIALYLKILRKLRFSLRKTPDKNFSEYHYGYISSMAGFIIVLATQPLLNLSEQYVPFWMVLALAYRLPAIVLTEKQLALKQGMLEAKKS